MVGVEIDVRVAGAIVAMRKKRERSFLLKTGVVRRERGPSGER